MYFKSNLIVFILILIINVKNTYSIPSCKLGNIEADSCTANYYKFKSTGKIFNITGELNIPLGAYLSFEDPIELSSTSLITFNCKISTSQYCNQIFSDKYIFYNAPVYRANLDLTEGTNSGINFLVFAMYSSSSEYPIENNLQTTFQVKPLYLANITTLPNLNVSYYGQDYFYYRNRSEPVSRAVDIKINTNCYEFTKDIASTLATNLKIDSNLIYVKYEEGTLSNNQTYTNITFRIYPTFNYKPDESLLLTKSFIQQRCKFNGKFLFDRKVVLQYGVEPTEPPKSSTNTDSPLSPGNSGDLLLPSTISVFNLILLIILLIN